ncbi:hypothetical protein Q8W30_13915 [Neptunomonas phycophila]|jgi:delta 1-pyrroline-5-carboxylate dehydrogenase|uniref:Uncharacterized protein n=1 Tax=Neptunomonas phycophila TaxID=1572645 RepID=A0ABT9EX97_9GAMM|nr:MULTISPECIES: hypothetical protein [Neptunomonas]MDN2660711.1 hypothetical protein [Neptunomonas sp. CHC150]MDP2523669.1 hypothetical protein [Neptunomonas phycophila]QLE96521.1 hypothetical protein FLM49_02265 [Neptunomonas phycophila]
MTELNTQTQSALSAQELWNNKSAAARVALLTPIAQHYSLAAWLLEKIANHMEEELVLPGPTGEANTLLWGGRGVVAVCCDDTASTPAASNAFAAHAFTALATGNAVVLQACSPAAKALASSLAEALPKGLVHISDSSLETLANDINFAAYAFVGSAENETVLNRLLSKRGGALAQLISETDWDNSVLQTSQDYPWRFTTETTLTVNTTAVGGNASLLELGGSNDH